MSITGPLVGHSRRSIKDKYDRWYGFVLLGKDNRVILVIIAHIQCTSRHTCRRLDDTLPVQQTSLYLLDGKVDPNSLICNLLKIITTATRENQDIFFSWGIFNGTMHIQYTN